MSSKARWRETFQKTRSLSQTSLGNVNEVKRKTSLLEEGDLSLSDDELEEYLGTIKKKSGLNRLWKGNTFDRVIDRTPDVSISSVSTDKEVPIEEDKTANSDNDFLPNIMALPSVATEDNNTDISEPSSIKPFQTVNLMSDLELSEAPLEITNNVKLALSEPESVDVIDKEIKSIGNDISDVEEVQTLDEISEVIEDLSHVSKQSTNSSYSKHRSHQPKDRQSSRRSQQSTDNETGQSFQKSSQRNSQNKRRSKSRSESKHSTRSSTKSKHSSQHASEHSSLDTSRKQTKSHSRHSKAESSGKSDVSSKISEDSYTADFSESSKQTESSRGRGSTSSGTSSARSSTKRTKLKSIEEISKKTSKHRMNQCYHDVATQVNMDDVNRQKLGVGMATLGPSFGHHYVDPSPIARHVVNADALEAVTAYNPAVVALTDMLRQQLRLVEQFVNNSRRMYESYTNNLNTTYRYTTLEDTLQYIDENRDRHNSSEAATKK